MDKHSRGVVSFFAGFLFVLMMPAAAWANGYYEGKTIRFVVGYAAGGGYDVYARAIARHMHKYISGDPAIIVENMAGAGSLIAANYVYNKAEPDGLTVGVFASGLILQDSLGDPRVRLDGRKFNWIGAPSRASPACAMMGFSGFKTPEDVLNTKRPIRLGATRAGSSTHDVPKLLNNVLGTKFDIITGYGGTSKVRLAMQTREVEGACWTWESMRTTARAMLDASGEEKLIPVFIHRKWEDPEVSHLTPIRELIKGEENLATYKAYGAAYEFFRPFALPPKVPKALVQMLRGAFTETMKDKEFLAEADKSGLTIEYVSAEELAGHVNDMYSMSPRVKANLGFMVRKKKK